YLESSLDMLTKEQEKFRTQMAQAFGANPFGTNAFGSMEDHVRRNMELFERTFSMFQPFQRKDESTVVAKSGDESEIETLRRQMKDMQEKLDRMSSSEGGKA